MCLVAYIPSIVHPILLLLTHNHEMSLPLVYTSAENMEGIAGCRPLIDAKYSLAMT